MADDKSKKGNQDRAKVSASEKYETSYTAKKTGTTPRDVREAVKKVGNSREKVERELKRK